MAKTTEVKKEAPQGLRLAALAKEFGIPSKNLLEKAQELKMDIKNVSSFLTRGQADRLRAKFAAGELRAEAEKKKTQLAAEKKAKAAPVEEVEVAPAPEVAPVESVAAFGIQPLPAEPEAPSISEEKVQEVEPEPAPVEPVAVVQTANAPESAPAPVQEAPVVTPNAAKFIPARPPAEPPQKQEPSEPPRMLQAGPTLVKPIQRDLDNRFGVVKSADQARSEQPPDARRGGKATTARGPAQVESKAVDDFKAQVTYPKLPESQAEDEEGGRGRGGRGGGGGRSGPGIASPRGRGGLRKGVSSGPRHGRALLQEDDRFRGRKKGKGLAKAPPKPVAPRTGPAEVTSPVTIKGLCEALGIKAALLIGKFFTEGKVVKINDILSDEDAELYAAEFDPLKFGIKIKKARDIEEEMLSAADKPDLPEQLRPRAPIVTIMGHVDHGKTSLLDYIRKSNVAGGEAGGITQHIRSYRVHRPSGDVVFLDTPGHKAFTEMRARGANVTDMVVLVVSAVDGVMPQTEEAVAHVRAANKTMLVAINKMDLPEADSNRIKGQLAAKEIFVEGYGGTVGCVEISAKTGQGVNDLLDRVLLESEVLQLKSNPDKLAVGTVIEAHKDQGRGIVVTLLVQEGTLRSGDVIVCGHAYGNVRQLLDDRGQMLEEAGPAVPVLVTGLNDVPLAGERFHALEEIKTAAEIAQKRAMLLRQEGLVARRAVTLENLSDMLAQGQAAALKLIIKVDVMGSLGPIEQAVTELGTGEVKVQVLHAAVGAVNETDIHLADASKAVVIGFNVSADPGARRLAEERGVEIRTYSVIYEVVDEMRKALEGMLKPLQKEVVTGHVEIRQLFKISKVGMIAGCYVTDGTISRNSHVRLLRDSVPVWNGRLASLKRIKDDAREVREGFECGIKLDGFDDIKSGDVIEAYAVEEVARTLEGSRG